MKREGLEDLVPLVQGAATLDTTDTWARKLMAVGAVSYVVERCQPGLQPLHVSCDHHRHVQRQSNLNVHQQRNG